jgi:tetratricopeptide (TPR) repeat protein
MERIRSLSSKHLQSSRIYMAIRLSKANAIAGIAGAIFGGLSLSVTILALGRDLVDFKIPGISQSQANDISGDNTLLSYKQDLDEYTQAIVLNSKDAEAHYHRGRLYHYQLNNPNAALDDYDRAISINPQYAKALHDRGRLKGEILDNYGGALNDFNKAIFI